jgi:hypothetical protein
MFRDFWNTFLEHLVQSFGFPGCKDDFRYQKRCKTRVLHLCFVLEPRITAGSKP